jgi:hypothetical protein
MDVIKRAMIIASKENNGLPIFWNTMEYVNRKWTAVTYLCVGEKLFYNEDGTSEVKVIGEKSLIRIK